MRAHRVLLLGVLAACGDDGTTARIDAPGSGTDARADAHVQANCTFQEMADPTNDVSAMAENTNITFASTVTLCGAINNGHFDSTQALVDQDIYKLTFSADTDLILHFTGDGAANLDELAVQVAQSNGAAGYGSWVNDHGALVAHVTAGTWFVAVGGFKSTDASAAFDYRVTIATDTPATRCAHKTTGGYTEANDTAANNGNDMLLFDEAASPTKSLTASSTDAAEPSGITTAPSTQYRLTGTAANVNPTDSYMDRDTYEFTTGASTNEISVRLNWTSTAADFDYLVLPAGTTAPVVSSLRSRSSEDEFQTFSVKPNTTYWLWVGAYDASTLPATYDATICGESFTP